MVQEVFLTVHTGRGVHNQWTTGLSHWRQCYRLVKILKANSRIPCRAPTMPLCKRLLKATAQHGKGTVWYMWINIGRLSTACVRSAQVRCLPSTTRSFTIDSSDFPGYTRTYTKDTALSENGIGIARHVWISATRHGRGTAWCVWTSLEQQSRKSGVILHYLNAVLLN
jgi:hypothetical protein